MWPFEDFLLGYVLVRLFPRWRTFRPSGARQSQTQAGAEGVVSAECGRTLQNLGLVEGAPCPGPAASAIYVSRPWFLRFCSLDTYRRESHQTIQLREVKRFSVGYRGKAPAVSGTSYTSLGYLIYQLFR